MPPRPLARLDKQPLSTIVFDQILDRIVSGHFPVGEPMPPERQLCEQLGVSRTAIREALARLAQLRVIAIRHGGETRVLDIRHSAGLDLLPRLLRRTDGRLNRSVAQAGLEMRAAIAPDIARLAADRRDQAAMIELETVLGQMSEPDTTLADLQELSLRFWQALVDASGNIAYQLAFNTLRDAMTSIRVEVAAAQEPELRDLRGYRAIVAAVASGDGAAARRAAEQHIARGIDGLRAMAPSRGRARTRTRARARAGRTS